MFAIAAEVYTNFGRKIVPSCAISQQVNAGGGAADISPYFCSGGSKRPSLWV